jgi:hypothetical protein
MKEGYEETMAQNWVEQMRRATREASRGSVSHAFEEFSFPICALDDWVETPEGNEVWDFRDDWLDNVTGFCHRGWGKMCGKYADFR